MNLLVAFLRWLWTGRVPKVQGSVCLNCVKGIHVHDENSGKCIVADCHCGGER